jgi:hypothetical protein
MRTVKLNFLMDGFISRLLHERELVQGQAWDQVAGQDRGHAASRENVRRNPVPKSTPTQGPFSVQTFVNREGDHLQKYSRPRTSTYIPCKLATVQIMQQQKVKHGAETVTFLVL